MITSNAIELWYYLRAVDACQESRDWVHSFEDRTIGDVFDALPFQHESWLDWLIWMMSTKRDTREIMALREKIKAFEDSPEFIKARTNLHHERGMLRIKFWDNNQSDQEFYDALDRLKKQYDERYADMWNAFKASIREVFLLELERTL